MNASNRTGDRGNGRTIRIATMAALLVLGATTRALAADAADTCESGKNGTLGKYASCMFKAQGKFVKGGSTDTAGYSEAVAKCESSYGSKWQSTETKGAGMCPSNMDQASIQNFIDACIVSAEDALGGGTLPLDVQACNSDLTTCNSDLGTCNGDLGTCQGDLAACEAEPQGKAPKTGQTTCYDTDGFVIACAGTGQDGEIQKGLTRSFTDNGDGTITDNNSGLMWEKLDDSNLPGLAGIHDKDNLYTWANAFVKVADLNGSAFAGHTDWRLPNVAELQTLVNFGVYAPMVYGSFISVCPPGCTVTTCSCVDNDDALWSSTTKSMGTASAFFVSFFNGITYPAPKTSLENVRAVRAGS